MRVISERYLHEGKYYKLISPDESNMVLVPIDDVIVDEIEELDFGVNEEVEVEHARRRGRPRRIENAA